jgi:hypothetical protein
LVGRCEEGEKKEDEDGGVGELIGEEACCFWVEVDWKGVWERGDVTYHLKNSPLLIFWAAKMWTSIITWPMGYSLPLAAGKSRDSRVSEAYSAPSMSILRMSLESSKYVSIAPAKYLPMVDSKSG